MKCFLLGLFLLAGGPAFSQTPLPVLTPAQMRADFEALTTALTRINPHDYVRRWVNGYSQTDSILALRPALDTMRRTKSFFWLVNKALTYCQDGHTSVLDKRFIPYLDSADRAAGRPADTAIIEAYDQLRRRRLASYRLKLPLKYIDGQYTVLVPFAYHGTAVPAGAVLTTCDGTDIHAYVRRHLGSLPELHWDFARQRFYADNFAQALSRRPSESLRLTFRTGKQAITQDFALADTVLTTQRLKLKQPRVPRVSYLAGPRVLYIRMPVMRDAAWYLPRIGSIARRGPLRKIVLDVRDNSGGSDPEWQAILTHLVGVPIVQRITSCANRRNPRPDRLGVPPAAPAYQTPAFDTEGAYQLVSVGADTLTQDPHSLRYQGPIYVLQNENCFSSAGSLLSTCQFSAQLINVGNSTGWFAGFGSMPWVLQLPNSRILYWTEPRLDFTGVRQPADLFHNRVKVPIVLTARDYAQRYTYPGDWYAEDYLLKHDPVFRQVLRLK